MNIIFYEAIIRAGLTCDESKDVCLNLFHDLIHESNARFIFLYHKNYCQVRWFLSLITIIIFFLYIFLLVGTKHPLQLESQIKYA